MFSGPAVEPVEAPPGHIRGYRGSHLPALEPPHLLLGDVREFFASLTK
jgi:hypothetical protein